MKKSKKRTKKITAKLSCQMLQKYVRLKETDRLGYGYCCSCGQSVHYKNADGGHYQPKGRHYNRAAFDERNVHIQCKSCNLYRQGNPAGYTAFMLLKYPEGTLDEIAMLSYQTSDRELWSETYYSYKDKCKELIKDKDFEIKL